MQSELLQKYETIGKALGNKNRIEILSILLQTEKTVEQLSQDTNLSVANVSKHLQLMLKSRLVKNRKEKNYVFYNIMNESVRKFLAEFLEIGLNQFGEENMLKESFLNSCGEPFSLTIEEMKEKMVTNEIVLIDVRPNEEYMEKHIPGSLSIPVKELENYISTLPKTSTIVVYCRGAHCLLSQEAIEILEKNGLSAIRFIKDVNEWQNYNQIY